MDGVVGLVRVGGVALDAVDREAGVEAAAAADLDDLAQMFGVGGFADEAEVGDVALLLHPLEHADGAVGGRAFLVAGDEQADRAGAGGGGGDGGDEGGDGALHVAGAAAEQHAVADFTAEGIGGPGPLPFRHHVGVPGKTQMRPGLAAAGEQVGRGAERQAPDAEAERLQRASQHVLRAAIGGRDRAAADQRLGERGRVHQSRSSSLTEVLARVRSSTRLTMTAQARLGPGEPSGRGRPGSVPGTTTE